MLNNMKTKLFLALVTVITFAANVSAASACTNLHFQPVVPNTLVDKFE